MKNLLKSIYEFSMNIFEKHFFLFIQRRVLSKETPKLKTNPL